MQEPDTSLLLSGHLLLSAAGLVFYGFVSHALRQRRHPAAAVGWVLLLLLAPWVGIPLFLIFGPRKLARARPPRRAVPGHEAAWLPALAAATGLPPAMSYRALTLHTDGQHARQALLQTIDGARRTLDVCTFLLGSDTLADEVVARLSARAADGVRVRLLVDGVGLLMGGRRPLHELASRGVEIATFVPLRRPWQGRLNLRNHRKMVIADGDRLWTGGRNIAAPYFVQARGQPWRDLSFDLQGEVVRQAAALFEADWKLAGGRGHAAPRMSEVDAPACAPAGRCAQLVPSGPDYAEDTLHALLLTAVFRARRSVRIVTPYLVPDDALLLALVLAVRRGVDVEIVLPARSNHRFADFARRRALRELGEAGARLRFVPEMVHAKAIVVDDDLAIAGSANLDARSLFLNYELMLAFEHPAEVQRFARAVSQISAGAHDAERLPQPGVLGRLAEGAVLWVAFQL